MWLRQGSMDRVSSLRVFQGLKQRGSSLLEKAVRSFTPYHASDVHFLLQMLRSRLIGAGPSNTPLLEYDSDDLSIHFLEPALFVQHKIAPDAASGAQKDSVVSCCLY